MKTPTFDIISTLAAKRCNYGPGCGRAAPSHQASGTFCRNPVSPDRDELHAAASAVEQRLGRPVQATVRPADWISTGTGNFHATITQRPLVEIDLKTARTETGPRPR